MGGDAARTGFGVGRRASRFHLEGNKRKTRFPTCCRSLRPGNKIQIRKKGPRTMKNRKKREMRRCRCLHEKSYVILFPTKKKTTEKRGLRERAERKRRLVSSGADAGITISSLFFSGIRFVCVRLRLFLERPVAVTHRVSVCLVRASAITWNVEKKGRVVKNSV